MQIVNLTSMDVDVRMIDNDVGDADDDEREVSCGVVGAGGTIDAKLAQVRGGCHALWVLSKHR